MLLLAIKCKILACQGTHVLQSTLAFPRLRFSIFCLKNASLKHYSEDSRQYEKKREEKVCQSKLEMSGPSNLKMSGLL